MVAARTAMAISARRAAIWPTNRANSRANKRANNRANNRATNRATSSATSSAAVLARLTEPAWAEDLER